MRLSSPAPASLALSPDEAGRLGGVLVESGLVPRYTRRAGAELCLGGLPPRGTALGSGNPS